jgi:hypothetical protein
MRSLDDILQGVEFLAQVVGKCPLDKFNLQSGVSPIAQFFFQLRSPRFSQCSCRVLRVQVRGHRNDHSRPQGYSRYHPHPNVIPRQRHQHLRCVSHFMYFLRLKPTHMQGLCSCEDASTGPSATSHCLLYL